MRDFTYLAPESISDLCMLLAEHGSKARLMAGGTDLLIRLKEKIWEPEYVIDLKKIKELNELICDDAGITIGAAVTLTTVGSNQILREKYPFLVEAIGMLGSQQVRNRGTVVGNLCNASPLAETAPSLLVLEAMLRLVSTEGERWIPIHEFFAGPGMTILKPNEFVASVHIPESVGKGIYIKHSRRKEVDLASVSVAIYLTTGEYRIAFGAVAPTPIRADKAEAHLNNFGLSAKTVDEVIPLAVEAVMPITDIRATESYRKEMVGVLTRRALETFI